MIRNKKIYLTDITTSEGNLTRLSLICEIIARIRTSDSTELFKTIKEETGLTNNKVIGRHLHILTTLGLVTKVFGTYLVTSSGKALVKFHAKGSNVLNKTEKIMFFKSFFCSIPEQLYWVIHTIGKKHRAGINENAIEYFYSSPARAIWLKTIDRAVRKKFDKDRPLTRGMINKFETMLYWLSQLDFVKKQEIIRLTEKGLKLLRIFPANANAKELSVKVYSIATQLYNEENFQQYDQNIHKKELINVLREAYQLFRGEQDLSDLIAIQEFTSAIFASSGIILEQTRFYEIIQELALDGTVKSIILGRDGKPAFLVMD